MQSPSSPDRDSGKNEASRSAADAEGASTAIANRRSLELTDKERLIHEQGLISVLRELHDQLDAAVAEAYGLGGNDRDGRSPSDDAILTHLCTLNAQRAAEERNGHIRWLRPEFQRRKEEGGRRKAEGGGRKDEG